MIINRDLSEKRICSIPWNPWSKISETHSDNSVSSASAPLPNAFVAEIHLQNRFSKYPLISGYFYSPDSVNFDERKSIRVDISASKEGIWKLSAWFSTKFEISVSKNISLSENNRSQKYLYHAHVELNPFSLGQILLIYLPTKPLDSSKYRCGNSTEKIMK